jgi:hypothetical protein
MALFILLGGFALWCLLFNLARELHTEANNRRDDRILAAYHRQEAARYHAQNLAAIERKRRATAAEMVRVATEANGEIIEGTAVEVRR